MTITPIPAEAWALDAGAAPVELAAAWTDGAAADVPIGTAWDVVRISRRLGYAALARIRCADAPIGPVLETPWREAVEVVVPRGTAAVWPAIPGTRPVARGTLRCPPPRITVASGLTSTGGRRWIVPPGHAAAVTDADTLCEEAAAALLHRISVGLRIDGRRPVVARP
ncbi:hypothetical protein ACF08N_35620 [Streptomyces sp. NPDC015127]|uniref:hypothetical protein n=1 Tax=Streptomyces sp. NPDC015127 TaxID=3364939 RepID=UPI0036FE3B73